MTACTANRRLRSTDNTQGARTEEIDWRAYTSRDRAANGLLAATLVLGVIGAGVHLPLWGCYRTSVFAQHSMALYFLQVTAISVLFVWI
jgi:hypothetical protein